MKEIIIKVPDNCELKQDGNTYTIVEKEKKITYEDVARSLFSKNYFFIGGRGNIEGNSYILNNNATDLTNCTSQKQAKKLLAINKFMNVAKYLNGDWQPDWNNYDEHKYYIYYVNHYLGIRINDNSNLRIDGNISDQNAFVYFKSVKLAQQAIEILGEDTIKLAFCTDY